MIHYIRIVLFISAINAAMFAHDYRHSKPDVGILLAALFALLSVLFLRTLPTDKDK